MAIDVTVPPDDESPEPEDIRNNFLAIQGMVGGLRESKAGLARRPVVVAADESGLTEGEDDLGPDCDFAGGRLWGFALEIADDPLTDDTDIEAVTHAGRVWEVDSATAKTMAFHADTFPAKRWVAFLQADAGKVVIGLQAESGLTLVNVLGHAQSAGEGAVIFVFRVGTRLIITGPTSA